MSRNALLAIPVLMSLAVSSANTAGPLAIGATIPMTDVAMQSVDGKEVNLKSIMQPAGTLVIFTCNHCPFAKRWESRIVELGNTYLAKGIGVVAINANDPKAYPEDAFEAMQVRAKEKGMEFPYVVDATSNVARAFGATKTPEAFLFDKTGKLVYHGAIDDNGEEPAKVEKAYLKLALEAVVNGEKVAVAETKSIGCGIKFRS
jgi:thioredoxin-related protein